MQFEKLWNDITQSSLRRGEPLLTIRERVGLLVELAKKARASTSGGSWPWPKGSESMSLNKMIGDVGHVWLVEINPKDSDAAVDVSLTRTRDSAGRILVASGYDADSWLLPEAGDEQVVNDLIPVLLGMLLNLPGYRAACDTYVVGPLNEHQFEQGLLKGSPMIDQMKKDVVTVINALVEGMNGLDLKAWVMQVPGHAEKMRQGFSVHRSARIVAEDQGLLWVVCVSQEPRAALDVSLTCYVNNEIAKPPVCTSVKPRPNLEHVEAVRGSLPALISLLLSHFPDLAGQSRPLLRAANVSL